MVSSSWRNTWHEDFDRVIYFDVALHQRGLLSVDGRRLFVAAAGRLDMDVVHTAYVMGQATLG